MKFDEPVTLAEFESRRVTVMKHGFTDYYRDYKMEIWAKSPEPYDIEPEDPDGDMNYRLDHFDVLLKGCVAANYQISAAPSHYPKFVDDIYIDYSRWCHAGCPEGIVWASSEGTAGGEWRHTPYSPLALAWGEKMQMPMHEVVITTRAFVLSLVFHEAQFSTPPPVPQSPVSILSRLAWLKSLANVLLIKRKKGLE